MPNDEQFKLKCPTTSRYNTVHVPSNITDGSTENMTVAACDAAGDNCQYATFVPDDSNNIHGAGTAFLYNHDCIQNDILHQNTEPNTDKTNVTGNHYTYNKGKNRLANNHKLIDLITDVCDINNPNPDTSKCPVNKPGCDFIFKAISRQRNEELKGYINSSSSPINNEDTKYKLTQILDSCVYESSHYFKPDCPSVPTQCNVEDLLKVLAKFGTTDQLGYLTTVDDLLLEIAAQGATLPECAKSPDICPNIQDIKSGGPNRNFNIIRNEDYTNICKQYGSSNEALHNFKYPSNDVKNWSCYNHPPTELQGKNLEVWNMAKSIVTKIKGHIESSSVTNDPHWDEHHHDMHHHLSLHDKMIEWFEDRVWNPNEIQDSPRIPTKVNHFQRTTNPATGGIAFWQGPNPNNISESDLQSAKRAFNYAQKLRGEKFAKSSNAKRMLQDPNQEKDVSKICKLSMMLTAFEAARIVVGPLGALSILKKYYKHTDEVFASSICHGMQSTDNQGKGRTYITNCRIIQNDKCNNYYTNNANPQPHGVYDIRASPDDKRNYKCHIDPYSNKCTIHYNENEALMDGNCADPPQTCTDLNGNPLIYTSNCQEAAEPGDLQNCSQYYSSDGAHNLKCVNAGNDNSCYLNNLNQPIPTQCKTPQQIQLDAEATKNTLCRNIVDTVNHACCSNPEGCDSIPDNCDNPADPQRTLPSCAEAMHTLTEECQFIYRDIAQDEPKIIALQQQCQRKYNDTHPSQPSH